MKGGGPRGDGVEINGGGGEASLGHEIGINGRCRHRHLWLRSHSSKTGSAVSLATVPVPQPPTIYLWW
ncbi:hypothetical protein BC938DRAFT_471411 [Jimgerdemannia flammicorona]|uniref:Uncharacterized protein n=1 Tax=Jimgerdemannia flammicorona TaxID=994334 RepID=A0A433Q862_9FUNG|nr:hypothetical protein BC938DRAFT_471411 [Jimgerdemannia flammicorona]